MKPETVEIDVRDLLAEGRSPLPLILNTVGSLKPEQNLRIITAWEPNPLYLILGNLGFSHQANRQREDLWVVEFHRETSQTQSGGGDPPCII